MHEVHNASPGKAGTVQRVFAAGLRAAVAHSEHDADTVLMKTGRDVIP